MDVNWGLVVLVAAAVAGFGFVRGWRAGGAGSRGTPRGMCTRSQMRAAMKGGGQTWAFYHGVQVRSRPNESGIVIAPQQVGKTTRLAVGRVKDAPGACVVTGTKGDIVDLTIMCRQTPTVVDTTAATDAGAGPGTTPAEGDGDRRVVVFDPDRISGWPVLARWDIVAGCQDARVATGRAKAMVAARPQGKAGGGGNAAFFDGSCETVLRCLLHAAALTGKTMREVMEWTRHVSNEQPMEILKTHPEALPGWAGDLASMTRGEARETVSNTTMSLRLVLACLSDPRVLDMVCPGPGDPGIDIGKFVARGRDTLYLLSEGGEEISTAPLVTAFASAVVTAARRASQAAPERRLDPELRFVLDEAPNVAPLPNLQLMMSDGGGRGMPVWAFFQSFAQMRERWGPDGASTLWGSSSFKILLGGCRETDDLDKISRGVGEHLVARTSVTSTGGYGHGGTTTSSEQRERVLPVEQITQLPIGKALLLDKNLPAAIVTVPGYWERPDADDFTRSQAAARALTGRPPARVVPAAGRRRLTLTGRA